MSTLPRFIYFPRAFGDGHVMKHGHPVVIYAKRVYASQGIVDGSRSEAEVLEGRYGSYALSRCALYTDQLWQLCEGHVARRQALEKEYAALMKTARCKGVKGGRRVAPVPSDRLV